jgi:putative transposase
MSRKGDCWDNAPMECFWGRMKEEWLKEKYDTIAEAKRDIYEYVWYFYPNERPHQSNNYLTPKEYRERYSTGQ